MINRRKSMVMLSNDPDGTVIIFVHGFGGSPLKTWENFHGYLPITEAFKHSDLVFYSYNSKTMQANNSALEFRHFMDQLLSQANYFSTFFTANLYDRPEDFQYKRVILVAHSLGAIICRKAMLQAHQNAAAWPAMTEMVLFAPAHSGARSIRAIEGIFSYIPFLKELLDYHIVTVDDVDLSRPNCSLYQLRSDTQAVINAGEGKFTIAKKVVWAGREYVVNNAFFYNDVEPGTESAEKHTTVCKPYSGYLAPIEVLTTLFTV
jgi:alpha-beta hydrolase superfamily lysophospholipase